MAALGSASFFLVCFLVYSSEALTNIKPENITAEAGENVTLPCKVPYNNIHIKALEWSRPGLDPEYILVYRDGRLYPHYEHPSYQNRVDLQDKEVKDGDVSLILKDVKMGDTGTYECYVVQGGTNRSKRSSSEPISIINLEVLPPGDKDGGDKDGISRGHVGSVVAVILLLGLLASLVFLVYKTAMRQNPNLPVPSVKASAEHESFCDQQQQNKPELV